MGLISDFFGLGGPTNNSSKEPPRPLFGSGGVYDDQKKPPGSQYIVYGSPKNNEQEVKDTINASSHWGSLGGTCKYCSCYLSSKAALLDHEANCPYRR